MKVKVYAPLFGDTSSLDDNGYLELQEGARLRDVYRILKIPMLVRARQLRNCWQGSGVRLLDSRRWASTTTSSN